ncbi:MAG: class I tRNA ligase family protein [Patescibacteria group bacterium]
MIEVEKNKTKKSEIALAEERILARWKEKKIFEKTLEKTKDGEPFVFYDGPPFATGEPHYGHILTGAIKDAIPRYQTMKGRYVRRQWGWDCHGLPIENIIEQELNLSRKKDIEEYGVGNFNEAARRAVLRYDKNWKEFVPRLGRFVDMEASYKTMDATYSESIWWAFKTLFDKGLVYEGHKIMYVCPRCETSLSNFEVAQGYKDVTDISVTAKFEILDANIRMDTNDTNGQKTYLLAWTTTPWTLPGNTALAVNSKIEYAKISVNKKDSKEKEYYVLAKERLSILNMTYDILDTFPGSRLLGKSYKPLFDYYADDRELENREQGWKIYGADFVTTETGTGIVHIAPAFGEDDMNLSQEGNLPVVRHVSLDGKFKPEVKDFAGMYVKQKGDTQSADIAIIKYLAGKGTLFSKEKITHSYPLCWRCDTPLLNYAIGSWFVKVTAIRDKIVSENKRIGWVPEHAGVGRFGKWLEGARDWAISRSRYWGAPLPVWKCAECGKAEVFGSAEELSQKISPSGNRYIVIRHGESESNVLQRINPNPTKEDHLTEKGKEEAREAAGKLKNDNIKIDRIISSDFMRARETSEIVAQELGVSSEHVVFDKRLREINTGVFHDKSREEYHHFAPSYPEKFIKTPEGGENLVDLKHRALEALYDIEQTYKNQTILISTHEYASWMIFAAARGADTNEAVRMKEERGEDFLKNAEYKELEWKLLPRNLDGELDFHRPYIDKIFFDCECGGTARRIPDVFDCWFESGSMPYAQFHYMGEDGTAEGKNFRKNFPADFIAEGMDQTRGWFYSLLILGVGLFEKSPYKNVIVNGIILAEDGQKISKRLKNYPEVMDVVNKYGADTLRYYLLSAPIVRGEDLALSEKGIDEVYKKNIVRLNNVYSFYELYREKEEPDSSSLNILDKWIIARLNQTSEEIRIAMEAYELDRATKPISEFIDDLSTWYIRRSRGRFKGNNEVDKKSALQTTNLVLEEFSKLIAPFMPFIADDLYLKVTRGKKEESVHLEEWPHFAQSATRDAPENNQQLIESMKKTRQIVSLGLEARAKANIKVRQPLQKLKVKSEKLKDEYTELIKDEVNVKEVVFVKILGTEAELDTNITPELKEEGELRDLIRLIQDFRKKEGLTPSDRVLIEISAPEEKITLIKKYKEELKKATLLTGVETKKGKELSFSVLKK